MAYWKREVIKIKTVISKFNQFRKAFGARKQMNVYLDQSDSETTDKKAAFGNATIKIRIVFDIKSTPFLNISTPLFFEYKFRVIAQDMRNSVC